jgi:predicted negative regulator of RcsB-dependent stress response
MGTCFVFLLICAVILGVIVFIVFMVFQSAANIRAQAWASYQEALAKVVAHPSDPNQRQEALALGREYMAKSRGCLTLGSGTLFDELALKNDLDAAAAGRSHKQE